MKAIYKEKKEHFDVSWKEDKDPFFSTGTNSPAGKDHLFSR